MPFFPSIGEKVDNAIKGYCELYTEAEAACKRVEIIRLEGLLAPAVNELRYAGFHMKQALLADTEEKMLEEISLGTDHAGRAIHDAYDSLAFFYIAQCDRFIEEFKAVTITKAYPDYLKDRDKLQSARKLLSNESRSPTSDLGMYSTKAQRLDELEKVYNNFQNAREEVNKLKVEERTSARRFFIGSLIGIIAMLCTAVAGIVAWLTFKNC